MDRYFGHYDKFQNKSEAVKGEDQILTIDSDIGRAVHFKRISVHHVVLPPHCRSSMPHAESLEEEFVFVVKGKPDAWINGEIVHAAPGFAFGFPAGTGLAHCFINNTNEDVHLIVAGDKTKNENLCSFPINPEMEKISGIWWENPPVHQLGPHRGMPGPIQKNEEANQIHSCVVDSFNLPLGDVFHYPGDNESFGHGQRLSSLLGLKSLGIWFERLPKNRRSAFPHAHSHEDELVFILKGEGKLWLHGEIQNLGQNDFAAFPSGTGLAHTLINENEDELVYLCIGEAIDFPEEKLTYPVHPLRIAEFKRKKLYWDEAPEHLMKSESSSPQSPFPNHLSFKIASEVHLQDVFEVFNSSPEYFRRVDGCLPTIKMAKQALVDGPKKTVPEYFKEFLIILHNQKQIGVLDLHAHHPEKGTCYLGLLLLREDVFGRGLGKTCFELAQDYVKRAYGCEKIRLGVSQANDVTTFWEKMGFKPNGRTYEWQGEGVASLVIEYEKII